MYLAIWDPLTKVYWSMVGGRDKASAYYAIVLYQYWTGTIIVYFFMIIGLGFAYSADSAGRVFIADVLKNPMSIEPVNSLSGWQKVAYSGFAIIAISGG